MNYRGKKNQIQYGRKVLQAPNYKTKKFVTCWGKDFMGSAYFRIILSYSQANGISLTHTKICRSKWPRGLRRRSAAACLLRSWVRIPPGAWMFVCCECCVVRYGSLRRTDHSSRAVLLTVVRRCVWSRNLKNDEAMTRVGSQRHKKKYIPLLSTSILYIFYAMCVLVFHVTSILFLLLAELQRHSF